LRAENAFEQHHTNKANMSESDEDFDPQAEKLEKMAEEEEKLRKEGMAAESKRQEDVIKGLDTSKERQRLDSLHNLLDKTACYSKFVSSQIKKVDANIQGKKKSTGGDGAAAEGDSKVGQKRKGAKKESAKDKQSKFLDAEAQQYEAEGVQPELIVGGTMRDYQLQGTAWLVSLFENGMNGILGDEMGLGKTVQTIAFFAQIFKQGVRGPFLVVGPLSVLRNWVREVEFWCPSMTPQLYHGSQAERAVMRKDWGSDKVHVVVTSFEIAMRDVSYFQRPGRWQRWKYLAVDEGHRLKNKDCRLIRELKSIPVDNRLLLTGTPLQNDLTELWSLLNFILPEIFDSLSAFQSWFDFDASNIVDSDRIIQQEQENSIVAKLHSIMKPFMLRRQKKDVDLDIPLKKEIVVYCASSPQQMEMYKNILMYRTIEAPPESDEEEQEVMGRGFREKADVCYDEDVITEKQFVDGVDNEEDMDLINKNEVAKKHGANKKGLARVDPLLRKSAAPKGNKTSLNNMLMQLRKVCNHPYLFEEVDPENTDESLVTASGKMMLLDRLLPTLFAEGHKVLIFSQMTKMLSIIEDYMLLRKFTYCRLDGSTKLDDRQDQMDEFNNSPNMNCFLLSTRAGGLGINLVAADTVIIFDSDWNPQADLQAQDRCHRIGQKNPVLVYRFCAAKSVEEKMIEKASNKRRLEHLVVSNGKFVEAGATSTKENIQSIDVKELMNMLEDKYADQKVSGVLSDADIKALMDRSSLFRVAGAAPAKTGNFKVLEDDGGDVSVF